VPDPTPSAVAPHSTSTPTTPEPPEPQRAERTDATGALIKPGNSLQKTSLSQLALHNLPLGVGLGRGNGEKVSMTLTNISDIDKNQKNQAVEEFNSSLSKKVEDGLKQYFLQGKPIGPKYPQKAQLQNSMVMPDRSELVKKHTTVIYQRRNLASPFLKKIKLESIRESQVKIEIRNGLANFVSGNHLSNHFVVEIFSGEKDGKPEYIARRVNGFPLSDNKALAELRDNGTLSDKDLRGKMDDLARAVEQLNTAGYYHNDLNFDNIMYDADSKTMVLIDFELAARKPLYGSSGEREIIDIMKDIVRT
jgi:hypothetical protein